MSFLKFRFPKQCKNGQKALMCARLTNVEVPKYKIHLNKFSHELIVCFSMDLMFLCLLEQPNLHKSHLNFKGLDHVAINKL